MYCSFRCGSGFLINSSPLVPHICVGNLGHDLLQVMACRLFGAKPLPESMLTYCQIEPGNTFQWNLNRNSNIFIEENVFENAVCQNGGHLVQGEMSYSKYPGVKWTPDNFNECVPWAYSNYWDCLNHFWDRGMDRLLHSLKLGFNYSSMLVKAAVTYVYTSSLAIRLWLT